MKQRGLPSLANYYFAQFKTCILATKVIMKTISHIINCFLFISICHFCFGTDETNIVAIGPWSGPVGADDCGVLQARIIILEGHSPGYAGSLPETLVYLELKNVSVSPSKRIRLYFDPSQLQCELRDSHNQQPPVIGGGGSGRFPSACWVTLPYDATIRLRASWYGYGMPKDKGLRIPLFHHLTIEATNTNQYFLTGTFTVNPPVNHVSDQDNCIWHGTLTLPKMKISAQRR